MFNLSFYSVSFANAPSYTGLDAPTEAQIKCHALAVNT